MSTDAKGSKILARTFFNQLRAAGYNSNQIIGVATELIDLVTNELRLNAVRPPVGMTPTPSSPELLARPELHPRQ